MLTFTSIIISAAVCTAKTIQVTPTHSVVQERCEITRDGKTKVKTTTFKVPHRNDNNGGVPEEFVMPEADRGSN